MKHRLAPACITALGALTTSAAAASDSGYDRIWQSAELYRSESEALRSLALSGRLQADYAWFDADDDDIDLSADIDPTLDERFEYHLWQFERRWPGGWRWEIETVDSFAPVPGGSPILAEPFKPNSYTVTSRAMAAAAIESSVPPMQ